MGDPRKWNPSRRDAERLLDKTGIRKRGGAGGEWDPGDLKVSARSATPDGWLPCDGQAVNRTTYAELFDAIGISYGNGDGSTTFNVPDFRGRSIVGAGAGAGLTTRNRGDEFGEETRNITLAAAAMPSHRHFFTFADTSNTAIGGSSTRVHNISGAGLAISAQTDLQGGGGSFSVASTQPSAVANVFIKI